jgi:hypothetical protein
MDTGNKNILKMYKEYTHLIFSSSTPIIQAKTPHNYFQLTTNCKQPLYTENKPHEYHSSVFFYYLRTSTTTRRKQKISSTFYFTRKFCIP